MIIACSLFGYCGLAKSVTYQESPCILYVGQLPRIQLLGSSLSSGATRRPFQICHEALEDGIGDAPLEAPQRFLTGFALCDLLAVVGPAPNVRPGLADGYPMCRALLSLRFPASESL